MRVTPLNTLLMLGLAVGLLANTGCARHYSVVMTNGTLVTANSKPKLKGGYYVYKDAQGKEQYISQSRVREISAGSASRQERMFRGAPAPR
jgi:hypothetical protein